MGRIKRAALAAIMLAGTMPALAWQGPQTTAPAALPDGKFAVVKADLFPDKIAELKAKYDQVESQFKPRLDKLEQMAQQLRQIETDLRTKQSILLPEKYRQLQNDYEDLKRRGIRDETDLHEELDREIETATRPIREKISNFMTSYAAQRNIVAIFDLSGAVESGVLAFWHAGADITDDFVAAYNKANPVAGAPVAAPARPR